MPGAPTPNYGFATIDDGDYQDADVIDLNWSTLDTTLKFIDDRTKPPYWIAAINAASQSIPNTTETKVTGWDTVNGPVTGGTAVGNGSSGAADFTYSAGDLTVKKAGVYLVTFKLAFGANATGSRSPRIYGGPLGTSSLFQSAKPSAGATTHHDEIHRQVVVAANDILNVRVSQTSGGALAMDNDPTNMQWSVVCQRVF